jgi:hypothetical protein
VTFFYGPLALARDIRISGADVFSTIDEPTFIKNLKILPVPSPIGIWKTFDIHSGQGKNLRFCDFSSAGNTWDKNSIFNTWCVLKK